MYTSMKMSNETGRTFSRALFLRIKQYLNGRMNKKMNLQLEVQSYFQTSIKDVTLQYMNLLDMKKLSKTSNGRKKWRKRCQ
jgi:formiminotetrahydrofolate cyclodeaminase